GNALLWQWPISTPHAPSLLQPSQEATESKENPCRQERQGQRSALDEGYQPPAFPSNSQSCQGAGRWHHQSRVSCRDTQEQDTHQSWGESPQKQPHEK